MNSFEISPLRGFKVDIEKCHVKENGLINYILISGNNMKFWSDHNWTIGLNDILIHLFLIRKLGGT